MSQAIIRCLRQFGRGSTSFYSTSTSPLLSKAPKSTPTAETVATQSSCPADTVITGAAYLKNQSPVLAQPDDAYPDWLWTLLEAKDTSRGDDGPGQQGEKMRLRKENRDRIKARSIMK